MKKYLISANMNAGKKFKPAEYLEVGFVLAKNKKEALEKAQTGQFSELLVSENRYDRHFPFRVTTGIEFIR
jgi:hypothetical protein